MSRRFVFPWITAAGFLCCAVPVSRAEVFLDLYFGGGVTSDAEVSVQRRNVFPPQEASRQADFDRSVVFGGRVGVWSQAFTWLGAALDLSSYHARSEIADLDVIPLSLLLMLRWPLASDPAFPGGRVQPYLGLGPSLIYSELSADLRPDVDDTVTGVSFDVGWDVRAGIAWQFHRHFALFGEYRYLHFRLDYEEESQNWLFGMPNTTVVRVDTDIDTHQLLTGLSYRF